MVSNSLSLMKDVLASCEHARKRFIRYLNNQLPKHPGYHCTRNAWSYSLPPCQWIPAWTGQGNTAWGSAQSHHPQREEFLPNNKLFGLTAPQTDTA